MLALLSLAALASALVVNAGAEIAQQGALRVTSQASLSPDRLPRSGTAPVSVAFGAQISTTDASQPPQLRTVTIAINRHGRLFDRGLPSCQIAQIQPSTSAEALRACPGALIGDGAFSSRVLIPAQSPFPSNGKILAFNGVIGCAPSGRRLRALLLPGAPRLQSATNNADTRGPIDSSSRAGPSSSRSKGAKRALQLSDRERAQARASKHRNLIPLGSERVAKHLSRAPCHSRPAILAHVYGTSPTPTSYTIPFAISHTTHGAFGLTLTAHLPTVTSPWGFITGLQMTLSRGFSYRGKPRSYLSAACPAPDGIAIASFPLLRASYGFAGARTLSSTLAGQCRVLRRH